MQIPKITDLDIVAFHPRHLEVAVVREYEEAFLKRLEGAYDKIEALAKRSVEAVTLLHDGRIITCCGFLMLMPGVCELWQIPSIYAQQSPLLFSKAMKLFVEIIAQNFNVRRMQTTAPADELHDRWLEFLGFECDGILRHYSGENQHHKMWSRLWELIQ